MSLTTVQKQFFSEEFATEFSTGFFMAVHEYIQAMDENDNDKMRTAKVTIDALYPEELKKLHPGIEKDIQMQSNKLQFADAHFFLSKKPYYQNINCIAIDDNTKNVTLVIARLVNSSAYEEDIEKAQANDIEYQRRHLFATICWNLEGKEGDSHSDVIAPNGCYYSDNDIKYLTSNNYSYTQAVNTLATEERYKTLSPELSEKLSQLGISSKSTFEELSAATEQLGGKVTVEGTQEYYYKTAEGTRGWKNPTLEQLQKTSSIAITKGPRGDIKMYDNENSQVNQPLESAVVKMTSTDGNKVYRENDYVQWLLENFNYIARNRDEGAPPQIPTSIGVSIAMARTGNSVDRIGEYNFWLFPFDESLTDMQPKSNVCTFRTETNGLTAICVALHQDKYKQAISTLKEHMWECSEEDKVVAARAILMVLDSANADEQAKKALEFVTKYKMREWDTDKTEEQGGHADTAPNSSEVAKNIQSDISSAVKHFTNAQADKGIGVLITPIGPKYVKITKLPVGKTYCEPIYPDYVTVGDTVPEWVMSATYAEAAKQAEEAALKAAGISTQSEDEIALEYVNNKIAAFREQQFAAWCAANGVSYSNDTEKEVALQKYREAAAIDSANFTDGIWTPDDASRNMYKALLKEKAEIQYNGDVATAAAHLKYVEGIEAAAAEIQAREGSWNQDSGHQLSAAELGFAGGGDYSAVANASSTASTGTVTTEDVFEVTAYTADGGINGPGVTATGEDLKNKTIDVHVIAVDPDVIPLRTVVNMHFHNSEWQKYDGDYRALDTGGAIKGKKVDLFIGYGERDLAMKFGVQQATLKWNKPGITDATTGSGGDIEKAVRWAEAQKGKRYSQNEAERNGPDAYDCSSLVYWALQNAGFDIRSAWKKNRRYSATGPVSADGSTGGYGGNQQMGDADTIWQDIQTMGSQGWESKNYTSTTPKRGDILCRMTGETSHCGFAVSATQSIEAKSARPEVLQGKQPIDNFDISATAWTHIYRYTTPAISQPAQGTTEQTGIGALLAKTRTAQLTNQIMLVICSNGTSSYQCTFSFWEKSGSMWVQKLSTNQGKGGSNGFASPRDRGSYKAPLGSFPITYAFGHLPNPGTALTYHQTDRSSWVDINDQFNGSAGGGESVGAAKYDGAYDYAAVIGFNERDRKIDNGGTGSCIFLHCPSGAYGTAGCIAIPTNDMIKTLQLAKPGCWIIIAADVNSIANY